MKDDSVPVTLESCFKMCIRDRLYFNPGSCGPRRFRLPVTVGLLTVGEDGEFNAKIIDLKCD